MDMNHLYVIKNPTVYSEDINILPPRPQQIQHPSYHTRHSPTPPSYHLRSTHSSPKKNGMNTLVFVYSFRMLFKYHKQKHLVPIYKILYAKQIKESIEETVATNQTEKSIDETVIAEEPFIKEKHGTTSTITCSTARF